MAAMQRHWDIFCRVIDNLGDIGVCWRLARQLRQEYDFNVRLWVDDPAALAILGPSLEPGEMSRTEDGVDIRLWPAPFPAVKAADVVIEAFACDLPASYLEAMARRAVPPQWINLEYLSAEAWVEDCHGLASPHPTLPLVKHFFFPGFTAKTGGLPRERGLLEARDAWLASQPRRDGLEVSLFCYDTAPVAALLNAWAASDVPVRCRVPPGQPLAAVRRHLDGSGPWQRGSLEVVPVPYVPQAEFDCLLWNCDINFVRGEDSFVRAQWAAKPFVWNIYLQEGNAHDVKLEAFLESYTAGLPTAAADAAARLFRAWNRCDGEDLASAWAAFAEQRHVLAAHGRVWSDHLASHGDLAGNLVTFCRNRL